MLQCTAVTLLPPDAVARLTAPGTDTPDNPEPYVLCELGTHDDRHPEHAAHLRPGRTPDAPALWFFWTGSAPDRTHRTTLAPWCPAVLRHLDSGPLQRCAYADHHTPPHSWDVTDPLGDLLAQHLTTDDSPEG
ncbi:hypothetical protein [Streptomyces sp. YPW6]|uniref:hypothetical protein n=1 Tax=Streptomyces sp. YPW6 TaxID=2840373 RepID=UPI003EC0660F